MIDMLYQYLYTGNSFLLRESRGIATLVCSLSLGGGGGGRGGRRRLFRDVFATFATHADYVCDITDTDSCWREGKNISTHDRSCF